jgi:prepilin-type N-terminal cleavage/methylation domain-containing protein
MLDERGSTLIEVLVAVVVMALLMVAIIGGMGTSTAASGTHKRQAEAAAILLSSAERLKSEAEVPYVECAPETETAYVTAVHASQLPSGGIVNGDDVSIKDVEYWQGGSSFETDVADCHDSSTPIVKIQRITLRVESQNVHDEITILKRGTP